MSSTRDKSLEVNLQKKSLLKYIQNLSKQTNKTKINLKTWHFISYYPCLEEKWLLL